MTGGLCLNKDYSLSWEIGAISRPTHDGVDFLGVRVTWDRYKDDHKPSVEFDVVIGNFRLLSLSIYSRHHMEGHEHDHQH